MSRFTTEQARWQAVQTRDPEAHSSFIYAVITTNILCRPTCPARLARRANVRFYDNVDDALKAGFRPCKRCKPDVLSMQLSDGSREIVNKACRFIDELEGKVVIADVAQCVEVSMRHLHNLFKNVLSCTPAVYAAQVRRKNDSNPISDVVAVGFSDPQQLDLDQQSHFLNVNHYTNCKGDASPASLIFTDTTIASPNIDELHPNNTCETLWQIDPTDFFDFEVASLSPTAEFNTPYLQDIRNLVSKWDENQVLITSDFG